MGCKLSQGYTKYTNEQNFMFIVDTFRMFYFLELGDQDYNEAELTYLFLAHEPKQ